MSRATAGSAGSLGGLSNSRVTSALPSVKAKTVIAWELSDEVPEIVTPFAPTASGCQLPLTLPL
jgi:hypothetical protein